MKQITVEMIDALDTLRTLMAELRGDRGGSKGAEMAKAFGVLDDAEAFAEIDKAVADEELSMTLLMMQNVDRD